MALSQSDLGEIAESRDASTRAILESSSSKKLIVAGPGTGKTFTFRRALELCDGKGLAVTFIRNLVADLSEALGDVADVYTFHGFCHHRVRAHGVDGLAAAWEYYPELPELIVEDLRVLGLIDLDVFELGRRFHQLDDGAGILSETLALGSYYNAASHNDVVYRELRHLGQHSEDIPVYPLVVVDEYQDFSLLETNVITLLASRSPVLIAGDDDQALYEFKGASPDHIRGLATSSDYEVLGLPYCSRCTAVVVEAVNDTLAMGTSIGALQGRLDKEFRCFLPDKIGDSSAHPKIIHACCSVDRKGSRYPGRYISGMIADISPEDIEVSRKGGYPTALVIGPNPFLANAFEEVAERFPQAEIKAGAGSDFDSLKGYELLSADPASRLGWRIIIFADPFDGASAVLAAVLEAETELCAAVPDDYRDYHLAIAALVGRLLREEALTADEVARLEQALDRPVEQLIEQLLGGAVEPDESDPTAPTILFTSMAGAKGLSACHVFMVGMIDGHFPRDPNAIQDNEICSFVVGLSRTRKRCHLISVRNAFGAWQTPSRFVVWIKRNVLQLDVDKAYLEAQGF